MEMEIFALYMKKKSLQTKTMMTLNKGIWSKFYTWIFYMAHWEFFPSLSAPLKNSLWQKPRLFYSAVRGIVLLRSHLTCLRVLTTEFHSLSKSLRTQLACAEPLANLTVRRGSKFLLLYSAKTKGAIKGSFCFGGGKGNWTPVWRMRISRPNH